MDEAAEANGPVIAFLRKHRNLGTEPIQVDFRFRHAKQELTHPDIVEGLWDGLNRTLPVDCRAVLATTPALVIPSSGVVIAFALGMAYLLRLPRPLAQYAKATNARIISRWSTGGSTNAQLEIAPDWVFGGFVPQLETEWLVETYNRYATP